MQFERGYPIYILGAFLSDRFLSGHLPEVQL